MINKKAIALLLTIFWALVPAAAIAATTVNVPFLTWEAGKQQTINLGGPGSAGNWSMQLSGGSAAPLVFTKSKTSQQGIYTYTLDIPKDLKPGAYVVESVEPNGTKTIVAGVEVKARETYTITQIPTDLRLLAIIFAFLTAIFTVVRGRKYAQLSFARRKIEGGSFFYRFRDQRLASEGDSVSKYVSLYSGESLHRISPMAWSLLPWLVIPLGVFTAIKIQLDAAIPNGPIYLFFICAALGALDATTGIALALSLGFMHVALGNVTNVRSLVVAVTFSLAWYFPSIIAALINLTAPFDFKKLSQKQSQVVAAVFAALIGGASVVMSTIITDSLVINRQSSDLLRWPLAAVVAAVLLAKQLLLVVSKSETTEDIKLYMARVVSPSLATTLFFGTMLLVYVWTNQFSSALIGSVVISAPYFALFVVFPKLGRISKGGGARNMLIEALIVLALTFGVYFAIQALPLAVTSKSRAFILIGLIPSFIHALYSVVMASGEFAARQEEQEALA